jgi:DNA-binding CsgD family transcriptional regulator
MELQSLTRRIVSEANELLRAPPQEVVLFDVVVGGTRCILQNVLRDGTECDLLSPREREITACIARGRTNRAIARELGISEWTVNTHVRRAFTKVGVRSRAELVGRIMSSESALLKLG